MYGILQLSVESAHIINVRLNEIICQACDLNCPEGEFHFIVFNSCQ